MRVFAILSPCFFVFVYFSFLFGILFCLTSCSRLQKGLTVTSTSRPVNQSKNYIDDLQAGVLRTEVEEPSIGEKLLLAGLETCDKVGEERVTLAARW